MPEYDFYATVRSDLAALQKELEAEGVQAGIDAVAGKLGVGSDVALAALWRASKRHGESLAIFVSELAGQTERENARQTVE